jgi:hypothetical protein
MLHKTYEQNFHFPHGSTTPYEQNVTRIYIFYFVFFKIIRKHIRLFLVCNFYVGHKLTYKPLYFNVCHGVYSS